MITKCKNLKHGQYFKYGHLIARIVIQEDIVFFNSKVEKPLGNFKNWGENDVIPLTFQEAVLQLVQECIKNNTTVEPIPTTQVPITSLPTNQFFTYPDQNTVGFIYHPNKICYLTESDCGIWRYIINMKTVIPLTIQQATLLLVKKINEY